MDAGLGGSAMDWGFVQPEVAKFTRACSYDRAGMGYSDPGPQPRTSLRIVGELHTLLEHADLTGPLVLVGHSFGGYNVRLYAGQYRADVAGLVLVDASHEDQWERFAAAGLPSQPSAWFRLFPLAASAGVMRAIGRNIGPPPDQLAPAVRDLARAATFRSAGYWAATSEMFNIQTSAAQLRQVDRRLSIPLVVVTAGVLPPQPGQSAESAKKAMEIWQELQKDQARLSPRGWQLVATQSPHYVSLVQPGLIVTAIRSVVADARQADSARQKTVR